MKILSIVGARPQFIKSAALVREFVRCGWQTQILHTGQHYDEKMSGIFFDELNIPRPAFSLEVGSGNHGQQTGRMLEGIERVLLAEQPSCVVVYGDTNSTLAGGLAAAKLHIPVVHLEAGLRSFNRRMPEEVNRVLVDHLSTLLLAPTDVGRDNLMREGIAADRIRVVGDVMFDAVLFHRDQAQQKNALLAALGVEKSKYVLATIHRAENTDDRQRLRSLFTALMEVARYTTVVLPLHPRTRRALEAEQLFEQVNRRLQLIDPVGYLDMLLLQSHARLVVTDSGGVQKEAFFCGTPCAVMREQTEWVELVETGWARLISPSSANAIVPQIQALLSLELPPYPDVCPYGDGNASRKAAQAIFEVLREHAAFATSCGAPDHFAACL